MSKTKAYVYILHFSQKIGHAQHYTGWTVNVEARLAKHRAGNGGRLPAVFAERGIPFWVGKVFLCVNNNEARSLEWHLKHRSKHVRRYCTTCTPLRSAIPAP